MREMKDSGVEWIGEVPVNWEIVPIKADVSIGHGSDPVSPGDIPVWGSGSEPFKTCGEHKNGPVVLLGRKGTLDCPQLVTGLYWNVDTAFDAKVTTKKISLKYFYYAATCVDIKPYMTNTAKPSMTQFDWGNSRIPRPPLSEQRRIVAYLDERCAAIDEDIDKRREAIEKLKEYKKSLIAHAVTKGLDQNTEMKDSGIEWIGEVPADWRISPIWSVLKQRKETNNHGEESFILSVIKDKGVVPYSQKGNVGNKAKEDLTGYMIARRGDIVFNSMNVIIGSVGLSSYDGAISPAYYAVYPACNSVCIRYYDYVFQTRQFQYALRLIANGILEIRLKVNYRDFAHLKFPVPAREIQEEIADFLDERCAAIDEAISRQEQLIEKLGEYRKSIIHHAVTGKIDCSEA